MPTSRSFAPRWWRHLQVPVEVRSVASGAGNSLIITAARERNEKSDERLSAELLDASITGERRQEA